MATKASATTQSAEPEVTPDPTPPPEDTYVGPLQGWPPGSTPPVSETLSVTDPSAVLPTTFEDAKSGVHRIALPGNESWKPPPLDPYPAEVARLEALQADQPDEPTQPEPVEPTPAEPLPPEPPPES